MGLFFNDNETATENSAETNAPIGESVKAAVSDAQASQPTVKRGRGRPRKNSVANDSAKVAPDDVPASLGSVVDVTPIKEASIVIITGLDKILTRRFSRRISRLPEIDPLERGEMLEEFPYEEGEIKMMAEGIGKIAEKYPLFAQFGIEIVASAAFIAGNSRKFTLHRQVSELEEIRENAAKAQANPQPPGGKPQVSL